MWFAEQGTWYPENNEKLKELGISGRGAWLRHTGSKDADSLEESPFQSIIHSFWYVIVTVTTVGYGEVCPTTPSGKVLASVAILNGIIVLAMPIGVVGANFGTEYYSVLEEKKRRQRMKEQLDIRADLEQQEDKALIDELPGATAEVSVSDQIATEALRIDAVRSQIITQAESLDHDWSKILPQVMHRKLAESLRFYVLGLIGTSNDAPEVTGFTAKPKICMSKLVDLDQLTQQVMKAIATVTSEDDLGEFPLRDSLECRRKWFVFTDSCWEYAATMCTIERRQDPPEYFQIKARLAAKVSFNNGPGSAARPNRHH